MWLFAGAQETTEWRETPAYSRGANSYDSVLHLVAIVPIQTNPSLRVICVGTRSSWRTQQPHSGSKNYSNNHVIYHVHITLRNMMLQISQGSLDLMWNHNSISDKASIWQCIWPILLRLTATSKNRKIKNVYIHLRMRTTSSDHVGNVGLNFWEVTWQYVDDTTKWRYACIYTYVWILLS